MTALIMLASAALAAVAAAGVLRPFGRAVQPLDPFVDAVEDDRVTALRTLRDLEQDHIYGAIDDDEYATLRAEAEARAVATLKAFTPPAVRPAAVLSGSNGGRSAKSRARSVVGILAAGVLVGTVIALLASSLGTRTPGQPISGGIASEGGGTSTRSPLSFFEQRVREHPGDLAARLDLAQAYLDAGSVQPAIQQYLAALQIDPRNTEARSALGFLIYRAGRPKDGLRIVNQALQRDRSYPEALFFKGVILLRGLHEPRQAAAALRLYLGAAPFGSRRAEARRLLAEAERSG